MALHYAWRHAVDVGDEDAAASHRKDLLDSRHELPDAALAGVDNRPQEALVKANRAEELLDQAMDASSAAQARERLEKIRARLGPSHSDSGL